MKKLTIYGMSFLVLGMSTLSTGCIGKFGLTKSLYGWNNSVTGNKYINNLVFWVLGSVQIYSVTLFIDAIILNVIEFWTGSNPIAMKPGEKETELVKGKDGNSYEITATQNRFDIVQLTGEKKGATQSILFNPEERACSIVINGVETKVLRYDENMNPVELFHPYGFSVAVDQNVNPEVVLNGLRFNTPVLASYR